MTDQTINQMIENARADIIRALGNAEQKLQIQFRTSGEMIGRLNYSATWRVQTPFEITVESVSLDEAVEEFIRRSAFNASNVPMQDGEISDAGAVSRQIISNRFKRISTLRKKVEKGSS